MAEKLRSRKLWAAIITSVLLIINQSLGIFDENTAKEITGVICLYLLGQGIADVNNVKK